MHNHDTLVRAARADDIDALNALLREPPVAIADHVAGMRAANDMQPGEIVGSGIDTVVAEAREGLQGFLQLRWGTRPPSANWSRGAVELRRHCVRARHRGTGVAVRMLERALDIARSRDAGCIWLQVHKDAAQALEFYRGQGFRIAGTTLCADGPQRGERWVMHRALPATTPPARAGHFSLR